MNILDFCKKKENNEKKWENQVSDHGKSNNLGI